MGCNCKAGKEPNTYVDVKGNEVKINRFHYTKIGFHIFKFIAFLLGLVVLPIVNIFIIIFMFNILVLNQQADLKPMFNSVANFLKKTKKKDKDGYNDDEDEDEDDFEGLTEDDVILMDVDEITDEKE